MADLPEDFASKDESAGGSDRSFGVVFFAALSIYGLAPLRHGGELRPAALIAAGVFLLVALVAPKLLAPLNRLWTMLGLALGKVVNPIVMALLFFLTITPIALWLRMLKKDGLRRRFDKRAASYWIERTPPGPSPESMKRQF